MVIAAMVVSKEVNTEANCAGWIHTDAQWRQTVNGHHISVTMAIVNVVTSKTISLHGLWKCRRPVL
jgi:hypothetical protein